MALASCKAQWIARRAVQALSHPHPRAQPRAIRFRRLSYPSTPRFSPFLSPYGQSASQMCHLAQAVKRNEDDLLNGFGDKNAIEEVKHVLEMKESMLLLEKLADIKAIAQGGYPQAERCRISIGHIETLTSEPDIVGAVSITGNFSFDSCSHGDFLGAILATGIARDKLGDILLQGERGAQILIVPELVDFIMATLDKVGNVPVSCTRIPLLALEFEPPRTKSFRSVEASLRVDALASAGFKISRSKLAVLISNGDVRVNWTTVTKNGTTLKSGDIVSVSGQGRLKIGEIITTRKGKFAVELIRYL
ncbi:putative RNA-binding protein YlmH isoform X2 [Rhodamnia argentea]|uniref:RNA-binding protein YlmH isoform X2 n=1 Tax=Rhodamnia argentea TaxID=178133 RepID=A0A8B8MMY8_9MYRT|nr:putative RNA-binding protein YlmH isoform X2 [Rhodamnia argentea]